MLGGEEFLTAIASEPRAVTEVAGTARLGRRTKDLVKRLAARRPRDHRPRRSRPRLGRGARRLGRAGRRQRLALELRPLPESRPARAGARGRLPRRRRRAPTCSTQVVDGETVTVRGGDLWRNGTRLAEGVELTEHSLVARARRPAESRHRGARGVRGQHAPPPPRRGEAARRRDRVSAAEDEVPRPARRRRRARARLQERPPDRAAVHPELQAGARRGRRWRRRAARDRPQAARDRRRLRLGLRRGAQAPARSCSCTPTPTAARPDRSASTALGLAVLDRVRAGNQRGHRPPARPRARRRADRRRRHPLQPRRVHGAQPRRHGVDVRHAAQGGRVARRREGRLPARLAPRRDLAARHLRRRGHHRRRRRRARLAGAPQRDPVARALDRQRARARRSAQELAEAAAPTLLSDVRPPLPRRVADGRFRRSRDRDPRRDRPLRQGLRQRCRAGEPDRPDRRSAARA